MEAVWPGRLLSVGEQAPPRAAGNAAGWCRGGSRLAGPRRLTM